MEEKLEKAISFTHVHVTFSFQKFVDNTQQCFAFTSQANFPTHNLNLQILTHFFHDDMNNPNMFLNQRCPLLRC